MVDTLAGIFVSSDFVRRAPSQTTPSQKRRERICGSRWVAGARGVLEVVVVDEGRRQAATGSARILASARMKSCSQGQRAGRWSVHWRAERVSRAGI